MASSGLPVDGVYVTEKVELAADSDDEFEYAAVDVDGNALEDGG